MSQFSGKSCSTPLPQHCHRSGSALCRRLQQTISHHQKCAGTGELCCQQTVSRGVQGDGSASSLQGTRVEGSALWDQGRCQGALPFADQVLPLLPDLLPHGTGCFLSKKGPELLTWMNCLWLHQSHTAHPLSLPRDPSHQTAGSCRARLILTNI